ncbi:MAG: glycosyltransferase family 39 protein [Prochlorococcaceae cyanobacterium]
MERLRAWLEEDERQALAAALLALLGLCWLAFFHQLGSLGLMDKTEALFVEVGHQMLRSGDWVTPRWNGETFFDYPVWGYWMVALSFRLFGVSSWAARLPVALAASVSVLALFALLWQLAPAAEPQMRRLGRATLAASVLALSPGWVGWGRSSVTDMFLASAISLALLGFALADASPPGSRARALGHGALALFAGIAVLAKGPVGLLLPGLVILVFLALRGRLLAELRRAPLLAMAALFLGVTLPWYALATRANGMEFLGRFLGFSNLERFTSVLYDHPGPPWFYLPWLLLLLLPWSLFLPVAVARLRPWRRSGSDLPLLALIWLLLIVAFFSAAATKLPGYILPALPGGALLVALLFVPLPARSAEGSNGVAAGPLEFGAGLRLSGWINAALLALLAAAAALAPRFAGQDPAYPGFAAALRASGLPWLLATPLLAAALLLALLLLRRHSRIGGAPALAWLWLPNAAAFAAVLALVVPSLARLLDGERQAPIRELAVLAGQRSDVDEPLLVVGYRRYSVVHYSGLHVLFVEDPDGARKLLRGRSGRAAPPTLLLLGSDAELADFGLDPGDGELIARRQAHRLLRLSRSQLRGLQER